jgi:hypothetical protein
MMMVVVAHSAVAPCSIRVCAARIPISVHDAEAEGQDEPLRINKTTSQVGDPLGRRATKRAAGQSARAPGIHFDACFAEINQNACEKIIIVHIQLGKNRLRKEIRFFAIARKT